jgi:hypothetical protein
MMWYCSSQELKSRSKKLKKTVAVLSWGRDYNSQHSYISSTFSWDSPFKYYCYDLFVCSNIISQQFSSQAHSYHYPMLLAHNFFYYYGKQNARAKWRHSSIRQNRELIFKVILFKHFYNCTWTSPSGLACRCQLNRNPSIANPAKN